jgi:hypothetical protein
MLYVITDAFQLKTTSIIEAEVSGQGGSLLRHKFLSKLRI